MKLTLLSGTVLIFILGLCLPLYSQFNVSGTFQSSVYSYENARELKQTDFYQGLQFRAAPQQYSNVYFSTYLRLARFNAPEDRFTNPNEWDENIYNMYINWKAPNKRFQFRVGRQFVYEGVINGTLDGVLLSGNPVKNVSVKLFGGMDAPIDRNLDVVKWDEGNVFGGYLDYRVLGQTKVNVSYFQRVRQDETVWQLAGAALNGKYKDNLYYQAQYDYNMNTETYQGMRYRLNYYYNQWSFSGEYASQKPRIYEDSFFRIFRQEAYNQTRGGVTYQINRYQVGAQYIFTDYEFDQTNQVVLTFGNPWGIIGAVFQDGFGGRNAGVYGEIRFDIIPQLTANVESSFYNFERHTVEISEDATSFSGGLTYRPFRMLSLKAEVQESINSYYSNDLRGLFRLNYFFGN